MGSCGILILRLYLNFQSPLSVFFPLLAHVFPAHFSWSISLKTDSV